MKKIVLLLGLYSILSLATYSQNTSIDSLTNSLKTGLNDTNKVIKLNNISKYYIYKEPKRAKDYIEKAINLADSLKYLHGKSNSLDILAIYYQNKGDYDDAEKYYAESLKIREKLKNNALIAVSLNNFGVLHRKKGEFDISKDFFFKSLSINQNLNDSISLAMIYNNLGLVFDNSGQYDEAITYHFKSLEIREKLGVKSDIASSLNNIGIIFISTEKYNEALKYLKKSLRIKEELKNQRAVASTYVNIGVVYYYQEMYDEALTNFEKSKNIYESIDDKKSLSATISNMAHLARKKGDLKLSSEYCLKSIKIVEEIGSLDQLCESYNAAGNIFYELNDYESAKKYVIKAKNIAEENNILPSLKASLDMLYIIYQTLGNYKQANLYLEKYIEVKDSLFTRESNKQLLELQTKYETAEKEKEIAQLAERNTQQKLTLEKRNNLVMALIASFILISVITFFIVRFKRVKQDQKALVLEQKLLRTQMNPHFIFNAVSAIQHYIMKNKPIEASSYLSSFAKLMRSILNNSREEFISLEAEILSLDNYLKLQKLRLDNKLEYNIEINSELDTVEITIPPMLIQPFIENSIEHGILKKKDQSGKINISFSDKEEKLLVEIIDNGIGRTVSEKLKKDNHKSVAIEITESRIKAMRQSYKKKVSFNVSDLTDDLNNPIGTKVIFELPLIFN
ncbi:MAG: tetratricopeptide repeat protein [Bacteroidales bacterium]|jgi:tetratricopeptide (TPR) repeat protein|nr:tetratricopeptide repeat protein [Bacteroidales bacterium]